MKWIKVIFVVLGSSACIGLLLMFCLIWYRGWTPFIDDGKFHGIPRTIYPTGLADQEMRIWNSMTLRVFNKRGDDPASTVLLQNKKGDILWCIYTVGFDKTQVYRMQFSGYRAFPFFRPRVRGVVDWTFGKESTWWFIDKDGKLEEYWFSW